MPSLGPGSPGLRTVNTYTAVAAPASLALVRLKGLKHPYIRARTCGGGCDTVTPILVGACPSVLLVLVRLRGLKHPYIHTTLAPLGACRHEGGWGGPSDKHRRAFRDTRTRQAPASVPNTGALSVVCAHICSVPFLLAQARFGPQFLLTGASRLPASRPTRAERFATSGTPTLGAEAEAESQRRSCAQPRVSLPPNFRIQSLASCHCHYLFLGGCMIKG